MAHFPPFVVLIPHLVALSQSKLFVIMTSPNYPMPPRPKRDLTVRWRHGPLSVMSTFSPCFLPFTLPTQITSSPCIVPQVLFLIYSRETAVLRYLMTMLEQCLGRWCGAYDTCMKLQATCIET